MPSAISQPSLQEAALLSCRFSGTLPAMNQMVQIIDLKMGSNSLSGYIAGTGNLETLRFLSVEVWHYASGADQTHTGGRTGQSNLGVSFVQKQYVNQ